jgi:hypothetical protein
MVPELSDLLEKSSMPLFSTEGKTSLWKREARRDLLWVRQKKRERPFQAAPETSPLKSATPNQN